MNKKLLSFLLITGLAISASGQSKSAVVDINLAFNQYWKQKQERQVLVDAERQLQEFANITQAQVQPILRERQELTNELENPDLPTARKTAVEERINEIQSTLESRQREVELARANHQRRLQDFQQNIRADIFAVVESLAKTEGIQMVFDKNVVPYSEIDLTDRVIRELNKNAPEL
jgi:Skp family chaperone for outer membrane proteins